MDGAIIVCLVCGIILLIACIMVDDDSASKVYGIISGFMITWGIIFLVPPIKERTNEEFKVLTNEKAKIEKEIFIDTNSNIDTTYHYIFKNGTVKSNK